MRRRRMTVLPLLFCLLASPASALLAPTGAAAAPVTVGASTATPHFPQNIAFHLEASAASGSFTRSNLFSISAFA